MHVARTQARRAALTAVRTEYHASSGVVGGAVAPPRAVSRACRWMTASGRVGAAVPRSGERVVSAVNSRASAREVSAAIRSPRLATTGMEPAGGGGAYTPSVEWDTRGDPAAAERVAELLHRGRGKGGGVRMAYDYEGVHPTAAATAMRDTGLKKGTPGTPARPRGVPKSSTTLGNATLERKPPRAKDLLSQLEEEGYEIGILTYAEVLSLAAHRGDVRDVELVMDRLKDARMAPTPRMLGDQVLVYAKVGHMDGLVASYAALRRVTGDIEPQVYLYVVMGLRRYAAKVRAACDHGGGAVCKRAADAAESAAVGVLRQILSERSGVDGRPVVSVTFLNQCIPILTYAHAVEVVKFCKDVCFLEYPKLPLDTLVAMMECAGRQGVSAQVRGIYETILDAHVPVAGELEVVRRRYAMELQRVGEMRAAVEWFDTLNDVTDDLKVTMITLLAGACRRRRRPSPHFTARAERLFKTLPPRLRESKPVQHAMHECYYTNGQMRAAQNFVAARRHVFVERAAPM